MCEVPDGRGYAVVVDQVLKLILIKKLNIFYKIKYFCRVPGFPEGCMDWTSDPRPPPSSHAYQVDHEDDDDHGDDDDDHEDDDHDS